MRATELSQKTQKLETAIKTGKKDEINLPLKELEEVLNKLVKNLDKSI